MKIFYWKIRGLKEPLVTLAEYLKVPYELVYYTEMSKWLEDKAKLQEEGFYLANLPYIEVEGEKLAETLACVFQILEKAENKEL